MKKIMLFLISLMVFSACDDNRVFEENVGIPDNVWNQSFVPKFEIDIQDTMSYHNFYINVRNADGYPFRNLFMFITSTTPNQAPIRDTFECILADEQGRWLGDGLGDIFDNQILVKKGVRFPKAGTYTFEIEQGMRMEDLPLIMDVGIRVEKME